MTEKTTDILEWPRLRPTPRGAKDLQRVVKLLAGVQEWLSSTQDEMVKNIRANLCKVEWNIWLEALSYHALGSVKNEERCLALRNLSQVEDRDSAERAKYVVNCVLHDSETPDQVKKVARAALEELEDISMSLRQVEVLLKKTISRHSTIAEKGADTGTESDILPYVPDSSYEYDAFLCHASQDKKLVQAFAKAMKKAGLKPWVDHGEIRWGDNLVFKVQQGISRSRYVVVFLSKSFLVKAWPQHEFWTAFSIEINGRNLVLPLLCGIDIDTVRRECPFVLAKLYKEIRGYRPNKEVEPVVIEQIVTELRDMIHPHDE